MGDILILTKLPFRTSCAACLNYFQCTTYKGSVTGIRLHLIRKPRKVRILHAKLFSSSTQCMRKQTIMGAEAATTCSKRWQTNSAKTGLSLLDNLEMIPLFCLPPGVSKCMLFRKSYVCLSCKNPIDYLISRRFAPERFGDDDDGHFRHRGERLEHIIFNRPSYIQICMIEIFEWTDPLRVSRVTAKERGLHGGCS